jgi:hypothetical protein
LLPKLKVAFFLLLLLFEPVVIRVCNANILFLSLSDWASYSVESTWISASQGNPPLDLVNVNETEWRLQMLDVSGEDVRFSITKYLKNGTVADVYEGNIWMGSGNLSLWVVRRNLNVNDRVYENEELAVNMTQWLEFAGANRHVVYAQFQRYEADGTVFRQHGFFWDSETGVLCGSLDSYKLLDAQGNVAAVAMTRSNIEQTSLWVPERGFDFAAYAWWFFGFAVIVSFVSVFVVFYRRMLRRRRLRRESYVRKK